jgi:ACT domain-containing protein
LQNDVDKNKNRKKSVKNRPKSGNKVKINNKKSNNVFNVIKNYHKQYKPRPKTGNKFKSNNAYSNINKKENEIPVDNNSNVSKRNTKNNFYQTEKENILKNIQDLEMQKNIKINELMIQREKNDYINNENELNNNNSNFENYKNNIYEISNFPNKNKNISKSENLNQNVMNLNNNIVYNPIQFNIVNNLNPSVLNYQDKIQVLNDLNKNIGEFTSSIPKLVNKVNETLNKIYGNTDNPIKNAINKHPLVMVTSKATHKMIKSNIDVITEGLIEDLLFDCVYDLNAIDDEKKRREERKIFSENLQKTFNNLNLIYNNEEYIGNNYNIINGGRNNIV